MVCLEVLTAIASPPPYVDSMYYFTMKTSDDILRELFALLDAMPDSPEKERGRLILSADKLPAEMRRVAETSLGYQSSYCIDLPRITPP